MEIQNVTIEDAEELLDIYAPYVKYTAITFEYDVPSVEEFRQRIVNISDRLSVMHMPDVLRTGEHDAEPEEVWG